LTSRSLALGKCASSGTVGKRKIQSVAVESLSTDEDRKPVRYSGHLNAIRKRTSPTSLHVSPDLASQVVKDYLLPMFQLHPKSSLSQYQRSALTHRNNTSTSLETVSGTVYAELKLSDLLRTELEDVKEELERRTKRMKEAEQGKISANADVSRLNQRLSALESHQKQLTLHLTLSQRQHQLHDLHTSQLQSELQTYKDLYTACDEEKKQLSSALHEEKALCDKLRNRATELEQGNALMKMECDIMGERLKGLYKAVDGVAGKEAPEVVLGAEVEKLARVMRELTVFHGEVMDSLDKSVKERDSLRSDCAEIASYRKELQSEKERVVVLARERITTLSTDLSTAKDHITSLQADLSKAEKRFKDLEDEYNRLRDKVKQNRLKRKQYGETEIKVCRWCQKEFTEGENFNWSCRTHTSEFGDQMYWCCGKTSKEAKGCQTRKHESKDEDEDAKDREEVQRLRDANVRCSSCKEIGHRPSDCPKDPNVRSNVDLSQELKRLTDLKERKKLEASGTEVHQTMLQLFEQRIGDFGFGRGFESSDSGSVNSDVPEIDIEEAKRRFFAEVMKLKSEISFDQSANLVQFETMLEAERVLSKAISLKLRAAKSRQATSSMPILITPATEEVVEPFVKKLTLVNMLRKAREDREGKETKE